MINPKRIQRRPWELTPQDQKVVAVLIALALLAIGVYWVANGGHRGRLVHIDHARPLTYEYRIDVNSADWPEFAVLPGIGETLARRIVESRQAIGPFRSPADLQRVKGIGPKLLERMKPHLSVKVSPDDTELAR